MTAVPDGHLSEPDDGDEPGDLREEDLSCLSRYEEDLQRGRAGDPREWLLEQTPRPLRDHLDHLHWLYMGPGKPTQGNAGRAPDPLPGYELAEELGRGGMGVVYRARQIDLDRHVALKMILAGRLASASEIERFRVEFQVAARLGHPYIVPIYEVGEHRGQHYFCMQLIHGPNLRQELGNGRWGTQPDKARKAAQLVARVARAVHYAHQHGVIHRDLKPANILLDAEGEPHVTDFGLARLSEQDSQLTDTGAIVGTPSYMSPEQASGRRGTVTTATDIYSLGAILYELLTGRPPVQGETCLETLSKVQNQVPQRLRAIDPSISRDLEAICLRCLEEEPQRRYPSAEALATDLDLWLAGEPVSVRPSTPWERLRSWVRRRPARAGFAALLGLTPILLLGLLVLVVALLDKAEQRAAAVESLAIADAELQNKREEARGLDAAAQTARQEAATARRAANQARRDQQAYEYREHLLTIQRRLAEGRYQGLDQLLSGTPEFLRGWEQDHLLLKVAAAPRPVQYLGTHDWAVLDLLLSRDGHTLVSSGLDGRLLRWDTETLACVELQGGKWSEDGLFDHALRRTEKGREIDPTRPCFRKLAWVADGSVLAGASLDGKGILLDLRTGERRVLLDHPRPLVTLATTADGAAVLFGDDAGSVLLRDTKGSGVTRLSLGSQPVLAAVHVPAGFWVVGQADGTISLLDQQVRRALHSVKAAGPVWDLDLAPDGAAVAAASAELVIYRIDGKIPTLSLTEIYPLPGEEAEDAQTFQVVRFGPGGEQLFAGDDLGRLIAWRRKGHVLGFVQPDQDALMAQIPPEFDYPSVLRRRVTALAFHPDGKHLFTGGQGAGIKRWVVTDEGNVTRLQVGREPRIGFDPNEPGLLWVGDRDGCLGLWDSRTGKCVAADHSAHAGPITGLSIAADGRIAATCGADGALRFWMRDGNRLLPNGATTERKKPLRNVALSPDGKRAALYEDHEEVSLWDVASRRQLGESYKFDPGDGRAVVGLVGFNADGSRLAVAGPGASLLLFAGDSLQQPPEVPYVVADRGGLALAWHPHDPGRLVAGDTLGRIGIYPRQTDGVKLSGYLRRSPIVGLSFTPDGSRLASIGQDGTVWIFEPKWTGAVLRLAPLRPGANGLAFDPTGRRLAATFQDGQVAILETPMPPSPPPERPARELEVKTLLKGSEARDLALRRPAVQLDRGGKVHVLYAPFFPDPRGHGAGHWTVRLGQETDGGLVSQDLETLNLAETNGAIGSLQRSLALTADGPGWMAVLRRGEPTPTSADAYLVALRCFPGARPREERLTPEAANWGFDPLLFPRGQERPLIMHYRYGERRLEALSWDGQAWQPRLVGRRGDGYNPGSVAGPDGSVHLLFGATRFADERGRCTYLRLSGPRLENEFREVVDTSWGFQSRSVTLAEDGSPLVLAIRPRSPGRFETVVLRRGPRGWTASVALDDSPGPCSELTCDRTGTCRFAYVDPGRRRMYLLTGRSGGKWERELVWSDREPDKGTVDPGYSVDLVNLLDDAGRPVLVAARRSAENGWLRVLRPGPGAR